MQDRNCTIVLPPEFCILRPPSDILLPEAETIMTIRKRALVIGSLMVVASVLYGAAKYYSPSLVFYIVEQSLIQKAPAEIDPALLHERFQAYMASAPDKKARMEKLLRISEYLEKVQHLTLAQINELLLVENPGSGHPAGTFVR